MKIILAYLLIFLFTANTIAQTKLDSILPLRGLCIAAPTTKEVDAFTDFINNELAPRQVNTLILRVDFNYQYNSRPELRDAIALSKEEVKKIVATCKKNNIRLIPQINLLGHQSWAKQTHNLLRVYPEFDETPHVKMPEVYQWPNADSLYCKSYCPLHPKVHDIVFPMVDEICEVFEASAFHAGMDEVFYIGNPKCPRCSGKDKALLFAGEVNTIRDHLAKSGKELWIWGDRLLDGTVTGLGMWEASKNDTHRAIDMILKDVMICDWHYERADKTAVYFAMKGFNVATCPWRNPGLAVQQLNDMIDFRNESTPEMKQRFRGMIQTVWSGAGNFMKEFADNKPGNSPSNTFRELFSEIEKKKH
jgi:N-acetyl-beta-hexosaminidase